MPLPFSEEEDYWIKELYEHVPLETLMDYLPGRSPRGIEYRAFKLGLLLSEEIETNPWDISNRDPREDFIKAFELNKIEDNEIHEMLKDNLRKMI
jgi:hypothetical protein